MHLEPNAANVARQNTGKDMPIQDLFQVTLKEKWQEQVQEWKSQVQILPQISP